MISLIHPSRGRFSKAYHTTKDWISKSNSEVEHILSLDNNDPQVALYQDIFNNDLSLNTTIIINNNTCVVEAANHAAKKAKGDILIYTSDDFEAPNDWDKLVAEKFKDNLHSPMLLKVHDGLQKFEAEVLTIPIVNRALYKRLGYFFHPSYKSMWVDADLFHVCQNNHWIAGAPELLFQHNQKHHHYNEDSHL